MKLLVLESQQIETRSSFSEVHIRIDSLANQLDLHRKETAANFHQVGMRFDKLEDRFDKLETRFDVLEVRVGNIEVRLDRIEAKVEKIPSELATILSPFFRNVEAMLENHEKRIGALEH